MHEKLSSMTRTTTLSVLLGMSLVAGCDDDFEVWLVDQSNSPGQTFGGTLYVFEGDDLMGHNAANADAEVVDLGDAAADLCFLETGANPVRPHMIVFNAGDTHGIRAFVASGHTVFFDGATREPLACFRSEVGAGGAQQAHASFPIAGNDYVVVANQNGKKLERISTDYENNVFTADASATLDLAGCTTPNGAACQAAGVRPDNAPICPVPLPNGQVIVTLRGGGMFVVDPSTTPMSIVAEYDMDHVGPNGCGGTIVKNTLFVTSGGGTPANLYSYEVYALPTSGYSAANPVNTPEPIVVDSDDSDGRDAHGVVPARSDKAKYLWVADRGLGLITTYNASTYELENTNEWNDGPDDPMKITPDLLDVSPTGNRVFSSLRGPTPLSGDAHVAVGTQPGLGIFRVTQNGRNGELHAVVPITNIVGGIENADAHGVQVRTK